MTGDRARVALFWDKSFLWGLIAYDTCRELGITFDLLTSEDIHAGGLNDYDVLFVPGGWASDKIVALGNEGREQIRAWVDAGGAYLGICGGAGLALSHESGLGLVPVSRMPTRSRVPSFSGGIEVMPNTPDHPIWKCLPAGGVFQAWWPGQFSLTEAADVRVLAYYGLPAENSFVTDLPVLSDMDWGRWEQHYAINLDPERLKGEPAVIEASFGGGKVLLSYLHFETPGDSDGHAVLVNILEYLSGGKSCIGPKRQTGSPTDISNSKITELPLEEDTSALASELAKNASTITDELANSVQRLISLGEQNFLWYQRNEWILQWRRGVRGVEYSTLYAMLSRLAALLAKPGHADEVTITRLRRLREISRRFFQAAPELLMLERDAMTSGPLSPLKTDDPRILALREELFSNSKRCGGLYEQIINLADQILLPLLREELRL